MHFLLGQGAYTGFHTYVSGRNGTLLAFGEGGGGAPNARTDGGLPERVSPVVLFKDGKQVGFEVDEPVTVDRCWASNNSYYDQAHTNALEHWAAACADPELPLRCGFLMPTGVRKTPCRPRSWTKSSPL